MDQFKKRRSSEGQLGRIMRSVPFPGMLPLVDGGWSAATDVYETEEAFIAVLDISGVDPEKLSVVAEDMKLVIRGERGYPVPEGVRYVHRLEIDRGHFEKSITLPKSIDVAAATSHHQHGFLIITMPKLKTREKVRITVR